MDKNMHFLLLALNFNNGKFLNDFLDSVLLQDLEKWEVLVIDDASSDNSLEIIKNHKLLQEDNVKLICNSINIGINGTIKNALRKTELSQYVKLIATDDVLAPGSLAELACIDSTNDFVYSDGYQIDENGIVFDVFSTVSENYFTSSYANLARYVNYYPAPTSLIRAEILNDALTEYEDIKNIEDWPILVKLTSSKYKIKKIEFKTVYYRRHKSSLSYSFFNPKKELNDSVKADILKILKRNAESCESKFILKIIRERISQIESGNKVFLKLLHASYIKYKLYEYSKNLSALFFLSIKIFIANIKEIASKAFVRSAKRLMKFRGFHSNDGDCRMAELEGNDKAMIRHLHNKFTSHGRNSFDSVLHVGFDAVKYSELYKMLNAYLIDSIDQTISLNRIAEVDNCIYSNQSHIDIQYDLIFVNNLIGGIGIDKTYDLAKLSKENLKENGLLCLMEAPEKMKPFRFSQNSIEFDMLIKELDMFILNRFFFYEKNNRLNGCIVKRVAC